MPAKAGREDVEPQSLGRGGKLAPLPPGLAPKKTAIVEKDKLSKLAGEKPPLPAQQLPPLPGAPAGPPLRGPSTLNNAPAPGAAVPAPPAGPRGPSPGRSGRRSGPPSQLTGSEYLAVLAEMRLKPDSPDFVYLRRLDKDPSTYNPYALQIVPYASVDQNSDDFFTMSSGGITRYPAGRGGRAELTPLNVWERECKLYNALMKLHVFREYRRWKGFRVWRNGVSKSKFVRAAATLGRTLYALDPSFRDTLQSVRSACYQVAVLRLHNCKPGGLLTLREFEAAEAHARVAVAETLRQFSDKAVVDIGDVCSSAIQALEKNLADTYSNRQAATQGGNTLAATMRAGRSKAGIAALLDASKNAGEQFGYTIAAARRTEQRHLLSFIRLADYYVTDTLHTLLLSTLRDLLSVIAPAQAAAAGRRSVAALVGPPPDADGADSPQGAAEGGKPDGAAADGAAAEEDGDEAAAAAAAAGKKKAPSAVFTLEILLSSSSDAEMRFFPSAQEFRQAMDSTLEAIVGVVSAVERPLEVPELLEEVIDAGVDDIQPLSMSERLARDDLYAHLHAAVTGGLADAFAAAEAYMRGLEHFSVMVRENALRDVPAFPEQYKAGTYPLEQFRSDVEKLAEQKAAVLAIQDSVEVGIIRLETQALKAALLPSPTRCLQQAFEVLPQLAHELYVAFIEEVHAVTAGLTRPLSAVEDFVEQLHLMNKMIDRLPVLEDKSAEVQRLYAVIDEFSMPVEELKFAAYQTMDSDFSGMRAALVDADAAKEANITSWSAALDATVEAINTEVNVLQIEVQEDQFLDGALDVVLVLSRAEELCAKVAAQRAEATQVKSFQKLFQVAEAQFDQLADVGEQAELRRQLWASRHDWTLLHQQWLATVFDQVDVASVDEQVMRFSKVLFKLDKGLPRNTVLGPLRESVDQFKAVIPVLQGLRNPAMKGRHWTKVEDAIGGKPIVRDGEFTLASIVDLGMLEVKDQISTISTEATQELALEELLQKVVAKWADVEFSTLSYKESKDTFILGGIEDVQVALEDSMVTMTTILSSRFVAGIRNEVEKVEKQLGLFSETLDEWLAVQKNWMYLESIFSAPDIQRQLPNEAKAFFSVDKQFRDIMRRTHEMPNALRAGTQPAYLPAFQKANDTLERIQKNLEEYLETKRMSFPRFYFLSNDELLEILAQTKNVQAVQPHMSKCFDGIRSLDFGSDPKSIDILGMCSAEGERVPLPKNLKARGGVEQWLTAVEQAMIQSLKRFAKEGYASYPNTQRTKWVLQQAAQLVIMISQVYWCRGVEECFSSANQQQALAAYLQVNKDNLRDMTAVVRSDLSGLHRKIVAALITIDVHARDIVEDLIKAKVTSGTAFEWQMQLRYTWDDNEDLCLIRQTNAEFTYAYEYLGAQSRLVVTPMTDRCYMTLTGAMHLMLGGAPAGPAGTGKTETTKDLGKALGVQCVVFNCGDNLDYKFMGKFFSGLAQCGAWACFDEFNRIDIEVLSVVAQQLLTIQNALKAGLSRFVFEGREMRLLPTCAVFITMNPGYAGRTELPDNLKALFRPMAMMIPDYALVAEVMLFSEGFETSKELSRKMVKLYKLSSEQLSQQAHYDFGMRALKSVLVMAGALKRAFSQLDEQVVLIRAMRDSNLPKFLSDDAELFEAIVQDLFPGVAVPSQDHGALAEAIRDCLVEKKYQAVDKFVSKIIQMLETFNVRFGAMLVGPTGGGKTVVYRTLADALTKLKRDGNADKPGYQTTHTFTFNPKCIKMGELYGEYNLLTNEWSDGLGSTLIRAAVADTTMDNKWVVFDGPVDAIWIENMNTVLDDNCTLCLPNGERIKLNPVTMRMLFEVEDLAVASPATVSRCGMVYVPPEEIGWRPYVQTWADTQLPEELPAERKAALLELFNAHVDPALHFIRKHCRELIPSVDINLVTSTCKFVQALLQPHRALAPILQKPADESASLLVKVFAWSLIWGIGGNVAPGSLAAFDTWAKEAIGPLIGGFGRDTVFDVFVDTGSCMLTSWEDIIPKFTYRPELPYFQILVPNVDTTRFGFMLEVLLEIQHGVLFTGDTGVGKSVIVQDYLANQAGPKGLVPIIINFSAQTPAKDTQLLIENKLEKKRKTKLGAPAAKKIVLFIDDVNMPAREVYGAQPPVELLRQIVDLGGVYDRKKLFWKDVEDTTMVCACAPPGGGRQEVTARFFRHFTMLSVPPPDDRAMKTILSSIFSGFLSEGFSADLKGLVEPVVNSSVTMYRRICAELLPTPAKSHYTFNLRDLSKVLQGMLMAKPSSVKSREALLRLWVHESSRVFHDRLINNQDKELFRTMTAELAAKEFTTVSETSYADLFTDRTILWGDFLRMGCEREDRVYEEVQDVAKMVKLMEEYLDEYNFSSPTPMNLVFFMDAAQHAARVARILSQPRGNAMLVGVGGSGKQSITRFASHMAGFKCFSIELTRGYGNNEFREDLKKLYHTAGIQGVPVVFLFTDTQIVNEGFLEDINNLLNSGEVPGLFPPDEKERLMGDIRGYVQKMGLPETKDAMWAAFINRVRDNLHILLCMSPVGEAFRGRCRQFPSLINCCTIDWFSEWPEDALLSVSKRFLATVNLGADEVRDAVAAMCVDIHQSVAHSAEKFFAELRRKFYVTPKSYLDLISLYTSLLAERREELGMSRERLLNGLNKLEETNSVVATMKVELGALAPVIAEKSASTAVLLEQVQKDQAAAEVVAARVAADEAVVKEQAVQTKAIADDAKADLDEALPALEAAVASLNSLNKNDITEIKSFPKPPPLVQMTMEAVCLLLGEKTDWDTAKRVLSDGGFMKRLFDYDKDNIPAKVAQLLNKYVEDSQYQPETVARQSKAAMSLCMWTHAMSVYNRVAKVVEPKRQALANAESQLAEANAVLATKQAELQAVRENVAALQAQLAQAQADQKSLQEQADITEKRLFRAEKLTSGLADEQVRWRETAETIGDGIKLLVGDVFISSACIAYYGAFTGAYRDKLVEQWVERCQELEIPVSADCSLRRTLASPVEVREWNIWGLPTDAVSVDNGVLVTRGKRWPLMIDPQGQANSWIKAMCAKGGLRTCKLTDGNYLRVLEGAIRIGNPVLVEDVGEALDPALEPILQKAIFKQGGRTLIRLGDSDVDFDPNFRFYITTKMPNPHYLPEVCIKVTLINFTVTPKGLEDQLLGDVVRKERPDLEEAKDRLVVSIANDKKQLKDLEDKILKLLKESEGNILDDEVLINTLNNSKVTSGMISSRVKEAEETERNINEAREAYRSVAKRGSILYFVMADLALINPMYQYSLTYIARLFNDCIDNSPKSDVLEERMRNLMDFTTEFLFNNGCRGLFEEHKGLFGFLMATAIFRASGAIHHADWNFLLRGVPILPKAARPNPDPHWLTPEAWDNLSYLDGNCHGLKGLAGELAGDAAGWRQWAEREDVYCQPAPGNWGGSVDPFCRLLLIKILREEKLVFGLQDYVGRTLGTGFTEIAPWTLDDVYPDTACHTPIIFVLSTGADPTAMLQRFAAKAGWAAGERLHIVSLGQGQGPVAEALVASAQRSGDWVCLQNCHLASSWMLSLEKLVEEMGRLSSGVHPDFRLWLTSMPAKTFPVLVLQNGIKLTTEPPKGVRANVKRTYTDLTQEQLSACTKPGPFKKLIFALATFHAVVQERRKFGPLGWNIRYEFNASDFECSTMTLRMFLDEQPDIPWAALKYVIGQINYGGRVTDDLDRRCLMSILGQYVTTHIMDDSYAFTPSRTYFAPPEGDLGSYRAAVDAWPLNEAPEVFGMHPNANITFQLQETRKLMDTVVSIQPRDTGAEGEESPDETVAKLAAELESALQPLLSTEEPCEGLFDRTPAGQLQSLSVVLSQEATRFDRLTGVIRRTLVELQKAIKGLVVMSSELEQVYTNLLNNQVPSVWERVGYPSLKPLGSWVKDYHQRVAFIRTWLTKGPPESFWLPGFFFPQGFLTGVLQTHARKYSQPIDALNFEFEVTTLEGEPPAEGGWEKPEDGVLVHGLFVDNGRWDRETRRLVECLPGVMYDQLPAVHFRPAKDVPLPDLLAPPDTKTYQCPLYKTSVRAGVLSTTGQSTNFVLCVGLPIREGTTSDTWVLQGTALLCALNT